MDALSVDEYDELHRAAIERQEIVAKYDKGREEGAQIDPWEDPAFEVYQVTDRYGFIHDEPLPHMSDAAESKVRQVELDRTTKWVKMIKNWKKYYPGEKLTRRVYKGIPDRLRGEIWCKLLGVNVIKAEQDGIYDRMRSRSRSISPHIRQIDLDVNRTYRNHIMFREKYGRKQRDLFHVLAAYSMYNTEVGYCQGMSEIAALLLMYMNEEDAFWAMSQLFTDKKHGMHGLFIPKFPKLLRFQEHHDTVLKKFLPKVHKHLEREGIDTGLYTIKWFLQCFLDRLPFMLTLRLWDIFILDGERILTGMAYTVIKLQRRKLRKRKMDTLLQFFQNDLEADFGYDDDTVIDQLHVALEELRKAKMDLPPKAKTNELPTLPFGLEIQPSIREIIQGQKDESFDEHFRKNNKGGKAAYYRRRAGGHVTTPDIGGRSGSDTRSIQSSRLSEYSTGDQSSYYDTAANSRLSIVDVSGKTSPKSSRTSFAGSDLGSYHQVGSRHTPVPLEVDDIEIEDVAFEGPGATDGRETLTRDTTIENLALAAAAHDPKPPSQASDYDNMNGEHMHTNHNNNEDYDNVEAVELQVEHIRSLPVHYEIPVSHENSVEAAAPVKHENSMEVPVKHEIPVQHVHSMPVSKSDGYILDGTVEPQSEVWMQQRDMNVSMNHASVRRQNGPSPNHTSPTHNSPTHTLSPTSPTPSSPPAHIQIPIKVSSHQSSSPKRSRTPPQVPIRQSSRSSRSHPATPTSGKVFVSPRFVSQLEVRPTVGLEQQNGVGGGGGASGSLQMEFSQSQAVSASHATQSHIQIHRL